MSSHLPLSSTVAKGARFNFHHFGRNAGVGTSWSPVAMGGLYVTKKPAGAVALRVKAGGHASDTVAGNGARKVVLVGLDETGAEVSEELALAGTSASSATTATFIRLYRTYVSESGVYTSPAGASHAGAITIEDSGGAADWLVIDDTFHKMSEAEVGCYTVPLGYSLRIHQIDISSDVTKAVSLLVMKRESILTAAAPYQANRIVRSYPLLPEHTIETFVQPLRFASLTDVFILASVTAAVTSVTVDLHGELRPN